MCTQIKFNHQIWAAILLSIVLMTPVMCGRFIWIDSYEDTEPYYTQSIQQQRPILLNAHSNLMRHLRPPIKRLPRSGNNQQTKLVPCYFKLCPKGKREARTYWHNRY